MSKKPYKRYDIILFWNINCSTKRNQSSVQSENFPAVAGFYIEEAKVFLKLTRLTNIYLQIFSLYTSELVQQTKRFDYLMKHYIIDITG